jgi:ABC-type multidrug transport system fused ATPase/permease subunit
VRIDGHDVRDHAGFLRERSAVARDTFLFNDTVASNISYDGRRSAAGRAGMLGAHWPRRLSAATTGHETLINERVSSAAASDSASPSRALLKNSSLS